jgi:hypothetical protein
MKAANAAAAEKSAYIAALEETLKKRAAEWGLADGGSRNQLLVAHAQMTCTSSCNFSRVTPFRVTPEAYTCTIVQRL